jgi:hypothetical protein
LPTAHGKSKTKSTLPQSKISYELNHALLQSATVPQIQSGAACFPIHQPPDSPIQFDQKHLTIFVKLFNKVVFSFVHDFQVQYFLVQIVARESASSATSSVFLTASAACGMILIDSRASLVFAALAFFPQSPVRRSAAKSSDAVRLDPNRNPAGRCPFDLVDTNS